MTISACLHCDLAQLIQDHIDAGVEPGRVGNFIAQCIAEFARSAVPPEHEETFVSSFRECLDRHLESMPRRRLH